MLSNNDEGGHPCLVPDLRESAFNFSVLIIMFAQNKGIMFALGLLYMAFSMLRYFASMPTFWRVCLFVFHKWVLT